MAKLPAAAALSTTPEGASMAKLLYRLGQFSSDDVDLYSLDGLQLLAVVGIWSNAAGGTVNDKLSIPGTESQDAADLLAERDCPRSPAQRSASLSKHPRVGRSKTSLRRRSSIAICSRCSCSRTSLPRRIRRRRSPSLPTGGSHSSRSGSTNRRPTSPRT